MSDSSTFGEVVKEFPLKDAYQDVIHPAASAIGQTLALPIRAINVLLSPIAKWVMQGEARLDEMSRLVAEAAKNIPPEKLVAPEPYVAVPAMQAFTYSMDCEEIKQMYAKLLAKAINADEKDAVHPAYVEVIRQMSPLDARALSFLQENGREAIALCNIRWQKKSSPMWDGFESFRLSKIGCFLCWHLVAAYEDGVENSSITVSFENLHRLGLLQIEDDMVVDRESYRTFEESDILQAYQKLMESRSDASENEVALRPSAARITVFGKAFSRICLA